MRTALILALLGTLVGCDVLAPTELDQEIVVEGYLTAGERLGHVRLTRTTSLDEPIDMRALAVRNAGVRIELLDRSGVVEEVFAFSHDGDEPGTYRGIYQTVQPPVVEPLRTYRLVVEVPDHPEIIRAETTVPDTIRVTDVQRDTVVYRTTDQLVFDVSPPHYPGRQSVFVLTTTALQPTQDRLTPFAAAIFEDGSVTLADLSEGVSPLLNEENFERVGDGSLRVRYPWLGLNFYGRNRVILQALDDNLHDFIRSRSVQQGGSTLPPGEIPNVLEHVEGARGIFGSVARASVEFVVLPGPPQDN